MPTVNPEFLLNVLAIFLGGGTVQLLIALFRRRAEIRQLNTGSDSKQVESAMAIVTKLQEDGAVYRDQVANLQAKVQRLETKHEQAQVEFTQTLRDAHAENTRLSTRLAQLQVDLDIAERQNTELRKHLP